MSIIIYTCPQCGGDLEETVVATYPPIYVSKCKKCGWKNEKMDDIMRIPYIEKPFKHNYINYDNISNPCETCLNHPRNGGDGICHCILGNPTTY